MVASTGAADGRGRIDVYNGGATGVSTTASASIRGSEPGMSFGYAIASAGDVNGDGFGDLAVGAPQSSPGGRAGAGAVRIFLGGPSGLDIAAPIVLEGPIAAAQFGAAVQGVGDINSDGRADVAVGAPLSTIAGRTEAGTVSVFAGSATGVAPMPLHVLSGTTAREHFGSAVAGGGDINGDGVGDLVVGSAAAEPSGRTQAGLLSVFHGSSAGLASTADRTIAGATAFDNFGCALSMAGDVNGDGYCDVLAGACGASPAGVTRAGEALLFFGTAGGLSSSSSSSLSGSGMSDQFGTTLKICPDLNGDGFADLVIGAPNAGATDRGAILIFHGSSAGVATMASATIDNPVPDGHLPSSLSCPGDTNGDGFGDVVAGNFEAAPGGRSSSGVAMLWLGASRGLSQSPARTLEGAAPFDAFGTSIAATTLRGHATSRPATRVCRAPSTT